jgi:hypothetical protein
VASYSGVAVGVAAHSPAVTQATAAAAATADIAAATGGASTRSCCSEPARCRGRLDELDNHVEPPPGGANEPVQDGGVAAGGAQPKKLEERERAVVMGLGRAQVLPLRLCGGGLVAELHGVAINNLLGWRDAQVAQHHSRLGPACANLGRKRGAQLLHLGDALAKLCPHPLNGLPAGLAVHELAAEPMQLVPKPNQPFPKCVLSHVVEKQQLHSLLEGCVAACHSTTSVVVRHTAATQPPTCSKPTVSVPVATARFALLGERLCHRHDGASEPLDPLHFRRDPLCLLCRWSVPPISAEGAATATACVQTTRRPRVRLREVVGKGVKLNLIFVD